MSIELICFDMAGTTVNDQGLVLDAFRRTIDELGATVEELKSRGVAVALTTGFSPATREVLIDILGWSDLFGLRVSPADAGRGRPTPDMILLCALRSRVSAVQAIMVVGDTASDMQAGRRAGVGQCVGVLSGTDNEERLLDSGADRVVDSVVELLRYDILVAQ